MKFYSLIPIAMLLLASNSEHGVEAVALTKQATTMGPDDQYLTKVFRKWDQLGLDAKGEPNGKRVLTKDNAERAAVDIAAKWKGLNHEQAWVWVEDKFPGSWGEFGASDHIDVRDAYFWIRQLVDTEGKHQYGQ